MLDGGDEGENGADDGDGMGAGQSAQGGLLSPTGSKSGALTPSTPAMAARTAAAAAAAATGSGTGTPASATGTVPDLSLPLRYTPHAS